MWHFLWPDRTVDEVPITHVTNGVHVANWMARRLRHLLDAHLGSDWQEHLDDPALWHALDELPDEHFWSVRLHLKRKLAFYLRERVRSRWMEGGFHPVQVVSSGVLLNPYALTIGFARRFATYKRAELIFSDLAKLLEIVNRANRPVECIFAGKAHPADEAGKLLLQDVYRDVKRAEAGGRLVFVEDYDINLARYLVQGVDVWLNTPRRPMEASGTSGMKAALNGALNFSVLDGWWRRARVRALYKMGRSGTVGVMAAAGDFTSALKGMRYLGAIAGRDREVIMAYDATLADLAQRQIDIERRRDDIVRRRRTVDTKRTELAAERRRKETLLASVRRERGLYEQTLQELEESSTGLWAMIRKAEEERKQAAALAKKRAAEQARVAAPAARPAAAAPAPGKGPLPWPAPGPVVTPFGVQRHPQFGTVVFRRGIEIAAAAGAEVRAVSDGQVAYADWYKGYGQLVIVEHNGGVHSLYGHLARIDAAAGSRVQRGQVIGLVGDTGSLKGPKLYFELRSKGATKVDTILQVLR